MTRDPLPHRAHHPRRALSGRALSRRALRRAAAVTAVATLVCVPAAAAFADATPLPSGVTRAGGANRIETAIQLSTRLYQAGAAKAAVLSTTNTYADSIGGSRLASAADGPLLLTGPNALAVPVADEIRRAVAPGGTIYLLGQTGALSADVETQAKALPGGYHVVRLGGVNRYETAVAVAGGVHEVGGDIGPVYLATGVNFPDGLAVAPLAAHTGGVVVLTNGASIPPATQAYLAENDPDGSRSVPVGGPAAVARPSGTRAIVGQDRYQTAQKVAEAFTGTDGRPAATTVGLATGANWPDALVGAGGLGALDGPLLLQSGEGLSAGNTQAVRDLTTRSPDLATGLIVGGLAVVPQQAEDDLGRLLAQ